MPGLTPDTMAVVEFSLAEDGSVSRAEPVYTQGGREVALAFARAVKDWSWTPEQAKTIPAFYRYLTRVEMRCSNAPDGRSDVMTPLDTVVAAWFETRGVAQADDRAGAAEIACWTEQAPGTDAKAMFANLRLATDNLVPPEERRAAATRGLALAATLDAPQPVRTRLEIALVDAGQPRTIDSKAGWDREIARVAQGYRALLLRPAIAAEPLGAATLRLATAAQLRMAGKAPNAEADALTTAVADGASLPERHPLRVHALLSQANRAAAAGDLPAAAALFERTGLSEQQCALIAPRPVMRRHGASGDDYPTDALMMGFAGWTQVEFDIAADGRTARQRTLLAYPPFVFSDAAKRMVAQARYEKSYRPETGVACSANQIGVNFRLP